MTAIASTLDKIGLNEIVEMIQKIQIFLPYL